MTSAVVPAIEGYEVLGVLGRGIQGTVYRVRDMQSGTLLALKWMDGVHGENRLERVRFEREIAITARLQHPSIVRVLRQGESDGALYSVMELIEGPTLRAVIDDRPTGPASPAWRQQVAEIATPLFSAMQYLHNQAVLHRDLNPNNVIVTADGVPHLVDFGLALGQDQVRASVAGAAPGTLGYMAPELFLGLECTRKSDIYALGALLFELITGQMLFDLGHDASAWSLAFKSLHEAPRSLRSLEPDAPLPVDAVIAHMTAPAADRYFTVSEAWYDWAVAFGAWIDRPSLGIDIHIEAHTFTPMEPAFIGRETELTALNQALARVASSPNGACHLAVVEGGPGVGKTRLLLEWQRRLRQESVVQLRATSPDDAPYSAWREALNPLLEKAGNRWAHPEVMAAVNALIRSTAFLEASQVRYFRLRMHEGVRQLLASLRSPLVMLLDDVHRLDAASIELLEYLFRRGWQPSAQSGQTLVVMTLRKDTIGSDDTVLHWLTARPDAVHSLAPLPPDLSEKLVRSALGCGDRSLPEALLHLACHETSGNPQLILGVLRTVLESGNLTLEQGQWRWSGTEALSRATAGSLTDRLVSAVEARLQRLSPETLEVLGACAVEQDGFSFDELSEVCEVSPRQVLDALDRLLEAALLQEWRVQDGVAYAFPHPEVRQVARAHLGETARAGWHGRWLGVLRRRWEADPQRLSLTWRLTTHCEALGDWQQGASFLAAAVEATRRDFAFDRAYALSRHLDHVLPPSPEELPFRRMAVAELAALAGDTKAAAALYEELRKTAPDAQSRLRAECMLAKVFFQQGNFRRAHAAWVDAWHAVGFRRGASLLAAALAWVRTLHPSLIDRRLLTRTQPDTLFEICDGIVHTHYFLEDASRFGLALQAIMVMQQIAQHTQRPDLLARAGTLLNYPLLALNPPRAPRVLANCDRTLQLLSKVDQPGVRAICMRDLSYMMSLAGDPTRGRTIADAGEGVAREAGDLHAVCWQLDVGGFADIFLGRLRHAAACFEEGHTLSRLLQHGFLGFAMRNLAGFTRLLLGQYAEAETMFTESEPFETPDPFDMTAGRIYRAVLLLRRGGLLEARQLLSEVLDLCRTTRYGAFWELLAARYLARTVSLLGNPSAGLPVLKPLAARCRSISARIPLLRARTLSVEAELATLEGRPDLAILRHREAATLCRHHHFTLDLAETLDALAPLLATPEATHEATTTWTLMRT